jgi:hypothetical protein
MECPRSVSDTNRTLSTTTMIGQFSGPANSGKGITACAGLLPKTTKWLDSRSWQTRADSGPARDQSHSAPCKRSSGQSAWLYGRNIPKIRLFRHYGALLPDCGPTGNYSFDNTMRTYCLFRYFRVEGKNEAAGAAVAAVVAVE